MHRGFRYMGSNMFMGWIIPLVLIVIIAIAIYMIASNKKENNKISSSSALDILNERFAKGEIDEEEYIRRKKFLQG